jgi:hypothetical protein
MNKNSIWSRWCHTSALVFTLIVSGIQLVGCGGIEELRQRFGQKSSSSDSTALKSEEAMAVQQKDCPVKSEDDADEDEHESEDEDKDEDKVDADEQEDEADLALKAKKDKAKGGKGCGDTTTGGTTTPPAPTPTPTPAPTPVPTPAPTPVASLAEGQKIYNANCQGCHGALPGEKQGRRAAQILSASGVGSHRNVTPWPAGQASALSAQLAAESLSMALK